jgi:hypothetical protein
MPKKEKPKKGHRSLAIKYEIQKPVNILESQIMFMDEDNESGKIKTEQEEMKEESHQIDLKEGYEQDEEYEESKE